MQAGDNLKGVWSDHRPTGGNDEDTQMEKPPSPREQSNAEQTRANVSKRSWQERHSEPRQAAGGKARRLSAKTPARTRRRHDPPWLAHMASSTTSHRALALAGEHCPLLLTTLFRNMPPAVITRGARLTAHVDFLYLYLSSVGSLNQSLACTLDLPLRSHMHLSYFILSECLAWRTQPQDRRPTA